MIGPTTSKRLADVDAVTQRNFPDPQSPSAKHKRKHVQDYLSQARAARTTPFRITLFRPPLRLHHQLGLPGL